MRNVCLQTYRNNSVRQKVAYFFKKTHTSIIREFNNLRVLRITSAKFSEYYFYMSTNIYGDFQASVSAPLRYVPKFRVPRSLI